MASAPFPIERTLRVTAALHAALNDFIGCPNQAMEADLIARIRSFREAVEANILALPRIVHRDPGGVERM